MSDKTNKEIIEQLQNSILEASNKIIDQESIIVVQKDIIKEQADKIKELEDNNTNNPKYTSISIKDNTGNPDNLNLGWGLFDNINVDTEKSGGLIKIYNDGPNKLILEKAWVEDTLNYSSKININEAEIGEYCEVEVTFHPKEEGNLGTVLKFDMNVETLPEVEVYGSSKIEDDFEPEPNNETLLPAGNGFTKEISQPQPVGDPTISTANTMARWDVVPYQEVKGKFNVGIVAHHSYGIDRVDFSFNGGTWKSVSKRTLNPRTNVKEYWATIDAKDVPDGRVEVRAIAYPRNGKPRVLDSLLLWANAGETIEFPVYEIKPWEDAVPTNLSAPKDKWLTVKYSPGASQRVRFYNNTTGNIKLEGLNLKAPKGLWNGPGNNGRVWFDKCDYLGEKSSFKAPANLSDVTTVWVIDYNWKNAYYTDFVCDHVGNAFSSNDGIARNIHLKTIYEDVIRAKGLVVNLTCDKLVGGTSRTPNGDYIHADMFQVGNGFWSYTPPLTNNIFENIKGIDIGGQGIILGNMVDCAFYDIDLNITINNIGLRLFHKHNNLLLENIHTKSPIGSEVRSSIKTADGVWINSEFKDVVLRNVKPVPNNVKDYSGIKVVN